MGMMAMVMAGWAWDGSCPIQPYPQNALALHTSFWSIPEQSSRQEQFLKPKPSLLPHLHPNPSNNSPSAFSCIFVQSILADPRRRHGGHGNRGAAGHSRRRTVQNGVVPGPQSLRRARQPQPRPGCWRCEFPSISCFRQGGHRCGTEVQDIEASR